MRVPSARRFVTALCVLLLAGKGAQKLRLFVASMLAKFRALTATGSPTTPAWRLFSVFLGDLKDHRVGKVLLAGDHCIVQAKDGAESYKYAVKSIFGEDIKSDNLWCPMCLIECWCRQERRTPTFSTR